MGCGASHEYPRTGAKELPPIVLARADDFPSGRAEHGSFGRGRGEDRSGRGSGYSARPSEEEKEEVSRLLRLSDVRRPSALREYSTGSSGVPSHVGLSCSGTTSPRESTGRGGGCSSRACSDMVEP